MLQKRAASDYLNMHLHKRPFSNFNKISTSFEKWISTQSHQYFEIFLTDYYRKERRMVFIWIPFWSKRYWFCNWSGQITHSDWTQHRHSGKYHRWKVRFDKYCFLWYCHFSMQIEFWNRDISCFHSGRTFT